MENDKLTSERIYLHFGIYGINDFDEYSASGETHPAGASFSRIYWKPPKLGRITVGTPYAELDIDNVFKVMGTNFQRFKGDGIQTMDIYSSLHLEEFTTIYDAYRAYVELMKQINQKGWQQYFFPGMARIHKADNMKHIKIERGDVIDPSYIFTFDEWQEIINITNNITLNLYNHDLRLTIMLDRRFKDPESGKEQYMMNYAFITQKYDQLNVIKNSASMSKEELEKAYKQSQQDDIDSRVRFEERAREKGYRIDESYVDQDVWKYIAP